ncbi:MAG TPA: leishmanolysin-related zinc metalloendopeptidase [Gemmatimonadales bacterium]|nr:leishmanolysin-related zinc metalloendopeptidase [Gemmatimonadales bacterium]
MAVLYKRCSIQVLSSAGALLMGVSACGDSGIGPNLPATITLTPSSISFTTIGQTQQLSPQVADQSGNPLPNAQVSWSSSDAAVATVTSDGVVTAQGFGSAEVTATAGTVSASASVAVLRTPNQLEKITGDGQVGTAGQPLPSPLMVEVDDADGNPVAGAIVDFTVAQGGGTVATQTATTAADGRASTTFTLGTVAGAPQLVVASVETASLSAVFSAIAVAGPPASIEALAGINQQAPAGAPVPTPPSVQVQDVNGNPVVGVTVTFQPVSGGGSVTGGVTTTNAHGIAQVGTWTLGSSGPNQLQASAAVAGLAGNPVTFTATVSESAYDITVRFLGSATQAQRQVVNRARARWETLVTGDLPDVPVTIGAGDCGSNSPAVSETVDDLLMFVTIQPIDGPGNVLGSAGPCFVRNLGDLPILGAILLDSEDLTVIEAEGLLDELILHEMAHVMGFGSVWVEQGLLADASLPPGTGTDPHFIGGQARAEFDALGGDAYEGNKVPVENTGGQGTADGHWRESVFGNELMTGFINEGDNPLSRVTLASLADQGYVVNISGADPYTLLLALRAAGEAPRIELGNDLLQVPIKRVDSSGRVVGRR